MFDLEELKKQATSTPAQRFVEILLETMLIRFDPGTHHLWVWVGENKNPGPDTETLNMEGEEFHDLLYAANCGMNWPTTAGFLVDLISCGFKIELAVSKPYDQDFLDLLCEAAKAQNPATTGSIFQFVPTNR